MCNLRNLNPVFTFLSSYNQRTSSEHLKAALYALRYVRSTPYLSIKLYSEEATQPHTKIHHPFPQYKEAYTDA